MPQLPGNLPSLPASSANAQIPWPTCVIGQPIFLPPAGHIFHNGWYFMTSRRLVCPRGCGGIPVVWPRRGGQYKVLGGFPHSGYNVLNPFPPHAHPHFPGERAGKRYCQVGEA